MIAGEMCRVFTFPMVLQCGVNAVVLFLWQNWGDMGIYRLAGAFGGEFNSCLSPQDGDFTWDWLGRKLKSPLLPGPGGGSGYN